MAESEMHNHTCNNVTVDGLDSAASATLPSEVPCPHRSEDRTKRKENSAEKGQGHRILGDSGRHGLPKGRKGSRSW